MLITDMPNDVPPDETRMRAALGLLRDSEPPPSGHRPDHSFHRRRFVRDGEVAVTVINPAASDSVSAQSPRGRLMAVEGALSAERAAHARTRRALEEALATVQALETKHAHGELAHAEAIRHEQAARAQAEAELQQPQEARTRPHVAAAASELTKAEPVRPARRVVRRRPEATDTAEPEPVKWWLPAYRAGKCRR
jgi:hypothetical protein